MITTHLERIALQNVQDSMNNIVSMLQNSSQDPGIEHALSQTIQHFNGIISNQCGNHQEAASPDELQNLHSAFLAPEHPEHTEHTSSPKRNLKRVSKAQSVINLRQDESGEALDSLPASKGITKTFCFSADVDEHYRHSISQLDRHIDALATIDLQGMIMDVNRKMELITGRFRGELIGSPFSRCFTASSQTENVIQQLLQEDLSTSYELTVRSDDETETVVACFATAIQDSQGDVLGIFITARDVSEHKRVEAHCNGLLESAADAIMIVDKHGHIQLVNSQIENMFQYPSEELLDQMVELLVPQWPTANHLAHRNTQNKTILNQCQELIGQRKDGSEFPLEITLNPLVTQEQILVLRDISVRKHDEHEMQNRNSELKQANHTKDCFLASMSHEIRTPLNVIIGFTGAMLMKLPGPLNNEQQHQLQIVERNSNQLLFLINDLLDLARIESGIETFPCEPVSCFSVINELIEALQPMASLKQLDLKFNPPPDDVILQTGRRNLTQILLNLIRNAIKYTDSGGVVIELSQHSERGLVTRIAVTDTGIGIPPEDEHRLFQSFQRLQGKSRAELPGADLPGAGLGLYISQKLAHRLGGRIDFQRPPESGSTFALIIEEN